MLPRGRGRFLRCSEVLQGENSSRATILGATQKDTQAARSLLQAFQRMPKLKTDMAAESAAKEDARPEPDTFFTGIRSVTLMLPALGTG
ncbi:MAG: hypothetical protein ACPIOQ_01405 [Promethearchaeia archaeon]